MKLPAANFGVSKRNCAEAKSAFALMSYGAVHLALHPCSKLQGIRAKANKFQTPMLNYQNLFGNLNFGYWYLFEFCDLLFGILNFFVIEMIHC